MYEAKFKFTKKGGWMSKSTDPVDVFRGEITCTGPEGVEKICTIEGSWLGYLKFDDKTYWSLDETSMFKPLMPESCLPSDSRYREDSIYLAKGDLDRS